MNNDLTPDTNLYIDQLPGRFVPYGGRECLFFSGTAYLGISQNPAFQAIVAEEISRYGVAFGSSRNGNLRLRVYDEGEAALAHWAGAPAALTTSSGMMAGQAVIQVLATDARTTFIYGPHTHPALWYRPNASLPTLSFTEWANQLPAQLNSLPAGPLVIAVNSLDAVRSISYAFDWMRTLPDDRPITLVVDDSHGIGVRGQRIWADLSTLLPASIRLIVTASLAKAMGLPGGLILADARTLADIRHTSFFGGASPMAPAPLAAFGRAGTLYTEAQQRLNRLVKQAETLLLPTGLFQQAAGYPVFYTDCDDLYRYLLDEDIIIYSFAYPTPRDKANTRIVVSAFHEPEDLERLAEAVNRFALGWVGMPRHPDPA